MSVDPFRISGPAIISVSGGRTSGYMLWRILHAHGGTLPPDVHAVFANTGREMPATLDFVQRMQSEWGAPITWLEFTGRRADGFEVVSHNSASRDGAPFQAFLLASSALPNPVQRSCTTELKIRTIKRWALADRGWKRWKNVVGLRADEPWRVYDAMVADGQIQPPPTEPRPSLWGFVPPAPKPARRRERWSMVMPLNDAGVQKPDVMAFWGAQPFDLRLRPWEGNCDGCFMKSRAAIQRMQADYPERMAWWPAMEATPRGKDGINRRFRSDREPYAVLAAQVRNMPRLPFDETMIEGGEACGFVCGV
jgi:3'-phosphoadenosine 5'-phosphosulfate sulfotransferase (PAPS reductase)/FAD synthetase